MDQQGKPQYPLLTTDQIIKPTQVRNLHFLNAQQQTNFQQRIQALWEKLKLPPDHPEYMQAHKALSDMSHNFRARLNQMKAQQQQAAMNNSMNGQMGDMGRMQAQIQAQAQAQAQNQAQAQARMQQERQAGASIIPNFQQSNQMAQRPPPQFSERVKLEAAKFSPAIPPELRSRPPEEQRSWVTKQKMSYATLIQRWEAASFGFDDFRKRANANKASMSEEMMEKAKAESARLRSVLDTAQKTAVQFRVSLDPTYAMEHKRVAAARAAQAQQQQAAAAAANADNQQNNSVSKVEEKTENQPQVKNEETENDLNKARPTAAAGQENQNQPNSQAPIRPPPVPMQTAPSPSTATPGQPRPLTHEDAIASAQRSYSQSSTSQHNLPNPTPNPGLTRAESTPAASTMNTNSSSKAQLRPLNVAPLTASNMPANRPSYTGGQGPVGQQGQVALPKMPPVQTSLDSNEGGHVLSRNRLYELLREVTGGAAGDGDDALDADVEEILLEVADEFVDKVSTAACQLAKLRGSNVLELRDVQLIIERNYNIRVPGFASDELRTVKRVIPTPAWTQKMGAVQAAKAANGKNDP